MFSTEFSEPLEFFGDVPEQNLCRGEAPLLIILKYIYLFNISITGLPAVAGVLAIDGEPCYCWCPCCYWRLCFCPCPCCCWYPCCCRCFYCCWQYCYWQTWSCPCPCWFLRPCFCRCFCCIFPYCCWRPCIMMFQRYVLAVPIPMSGKSPGPWSERPFRHGAS